MKNFFKNAFLYLKTIDVILLLMCITCSLISVVCLYSNYKSGFAASSRIYIIQAAASAVGVIGALIISHIDYKFLAKIWYIHAPLTLLLVGLTFFIGIAPEGTDDKAWLDLGFTTLQPSELLKLSFVLTFALHLSKVGDDINKLSNVVLLGLHASVPVGLIILQGDYGSAIVFAMIFIFMILSAGISFKYISVGCGLIAVGLPLFWHFMVGDYLQERFFIFLHPEDDPLGAGFQQNQGKIAIGSGQLFGKGVLSDDLYYVPECYNDYIFSFIGQTMGFVGCIAVLLLILGICAKALKTSILSADSLGSYICVGIFAIIFTQTVVNILMVLCLSPVIGITLPFFSSGGTSALVSYVGIGLLMSVYSHNKKAFLMSD